MASNFHQWEIMVNRGYDIRHLLIKLLNIKGHYICITIPVVKSIKRPYNNKVLPLRPCTKTVTIHCEDQQFLSQSGNNNDNGFR